MCLCVTFLKVYANLGNIHLFKTGLVFADLFVVQQDFSGGEAKIKCIGVRDLVRVVELKTASVHTLL